MKPSNVLVLPGWQGSGPSHWQSLWELRHGYRRVEQHDWDRPLRGDWIARLEDVVLGCDEPAVLVASSDDPFCAAERARAFAQAWGSQPMAIGPCGHINADSGLGIWPEGQLLLADLTQT